MADNLEKKHRGPFVSLVRNTVLKTLKAPGLLEPGDRAVIDDSIERKYAPAIRRTVLLTLAATPAITMNPTATEGLWVPVTALTGLAWFAISLKEIKAKLAGFGVELTRDLLQAFLTSLSISAVTAAVKTVDVQKYVAPDSLPPAVRTTFEVLSLVPFVVVPWDLLKATIKFDANDTLLTGTTEASQRFFKNAISKLRDSYTELRGEHSLIAANFRIVEALEILVARGLCSMEACDRLRECINGDQKKFDLTLLPILSAILSKTEPESSENLMIRIKTAKTYIGELQKSYKEEEVEQVFADNAIAYILETIEQILESSTS